MDLINLFIKMGDLALDINKLSVFPSLILQVSKYINETECDQIYQKLLEEDTHTHEAFAPLKDKAKSSHKIDSDILKKVKINFKNILNQYSELTGFTFKNEITNSWFNIQKKDSVLKDHTHPLTVVAGVLFINVDDKASPIYFQNPNPHINYTAIEKNTPYSFEWVKCIPKKGDLYLFPGWLKHGSFNDKNMCENRTVISFNAI